MILLWLGLIFLSFMAALFIVWPLWRSSSPQVQTQANINKAWYQERLSDLEHARLSGEITLAQFDQNKVVLQKDFLNAASLPTALNYSPVRVLTLIFLLAFFTFSFVSYQCLGASQLLSAQVHEATAQQKMQSEIQAMGGDAGVLEKLKDRLKTHPDEPEGWYLLGRIYFSQNHFDAAVQAFGRAANLAPTRADIAIQLAEATYLSKGSASKALKKELETALKLAPDNPAALNLSALILYHQKKYGEAINIWQNLLLQAPAGSKTAQILQEAITKAQAEMPRNSSYAVSHVRFLVKVTIRPSLIQQIPPHATLFVYAKAVQGPPMPLAVARFSVGSFPKNVVLDDTMRMTPTLRLQDFSHVIIFARISAQGQAMLQKGDLQGVSSPISTQYPPKEINLSIDKVV